MKFKDKPLLIALTALLLFGSKVSYAQDCNHKIDTFYILYIKGTLSNGRPLVSTVLQKNLDNLKQLKDVRNEDDFICELYKTSIAYKDAALTLTANKNCYHFSNEDDSKIFFNRLMDKIENMNRNLITFRKKLSNNKFISIECARMVGDFWVLSKTIGQINNLDHSFKVKDSCYTLATEYNLKDILSTSKLSKSERKKIKCVMK